MLTTTYLTLILRGPGLYSRINQYLISDSEGRRKEGGEVRFVAMTLFHMGMYHCSMEEGEETERKSLTGFDWF